MNYPVIEGAQSFYIKGGEIGVLICHGFMGTPQSVRYLGERFAELGYTVLAVRLKGHGTDYRDLEKCTSEDWFNSLENGYKVLKEECSKVFVIGQSMGGALTLKLAYKYPNIDGIMLINAALSVPAYEFVRKLDHPPRYINEGKPDIKNPNIYEITYDKAPTSAIFELQKTMASVPRVLPYVTCPVLGIYSIDDHVVPPESTEYILKHVRSANKNKVVLENSYHVASMDYDQEKIVQESHQFIVKQVVGNVVLQ